MKYDLNQRTVLVLRVVTIKRTLYNGIDLDGNLVEGVAAWKRTKEPWQRNKAKATSAYIGGTLEEEPCNIFYTRTQIQDIDSQGDTPQEALNATIEQLIHVSQNRHLKDTRFMKYINKSGVCYCKEEEYHGSSIDIVKQMPIVPDKPIPYLAVYPILL